VAGGSSEGEGAREGGEVDVDALLGAVLGYGDEGRGARGGEGLVGGGGGVVVGV